MSALLQSHDAESALVDRLKSDPASANETAGRLVALRARIAAQTGQNRFGLGVNVVGPEPFGGCETACRVLLKHLPEIGTLHIVRSDQFTNEDLHITDDQWQACSGPMLAEHLADSFPELFPTKGVAVAFNVKHPRNRTLQITTGLGVVIHEVAHALGAHSHDATFVMAGCLIHHRSRLKSTVPLSALGIGYGRGAGPDQVFQAYAELIPFFRQTAGLPVRELIRQVNDLELKPPHDFFVACQQLVH